MLGIAKLAILSLYWDWITLPKGFRVSVATIILAAIALSSQFQVFRVFKSNKFRLRRFRVVSRFGEKSPISLKMAGAGILSVTACLRQLALQPGGCCDTFGTATTPACFGCRSYSALMRHCPFAPRVQVFSRSAIDLHYGPSRGKDLECLLSQPGQ